MTTFPADPHAEFDLPLDADGGLDLSLHLKRSRCAAADTMEYRLMTGDVVLATAFRSIRNTPADVAAALVRKLRPVPTGPVA